MTTRALVRTTDWDNDRIRDSLRDSVVSAEGALDGAELRLTVEPLMRRSDAGGLLQSLRVDAVRGSRVPDTLIPPCGQPSCLWTVCEIRSAVFLDHT
ncbi:hypothetical protein ACWCOW_33570, partial [Streptomyces sp. NPDC001939]